MGHGYEMPLLRLCTIPSTLLFILPLGTSYVSLVFCSYSVSYYVVVGLFRSSESSQKMVGSSDGRS